MKKNISIFIILLVLLSVFSFDCFAYQNIFDEANMFSTSVKQDIDSQISRIENESGFDIVVMVQNEIITYGTAEGFANSLYSKNDYGFGEDDKGVFMYINVHPNQKDLVLVINQSNSEIRITDRIKENILDDVQNLLIDGDYDDALIRFVYEIDKSLETPSVLNAFMSSIGVESFIFAIVICVFYMGVLLMKHRPVKVAKNAKVYVDNTSFELEEKEDTFLRTRTTSTRKSSSGGGSGGSRRSSGSRKF